MNESQFSVVPLEVIQDRRLTLEQTRVLIALFSFRNKVTNTVWPSRAAIAERTGMHPSNISSATTALVALGWLSKEGVGGHSKATRYTLCMPVFEVAAVQPKPASAPVLPVVSVPTTVADSATVAERATVADSATPPLADSATTPLADSATRKEESIEESIEQKKTGAAVPASTFVLPDWIPVDAWGAFMETRKAKKAKSTDYALGLIVKSLADFKADGYDPLSILNNSVRAGWSDVYPPKSFAGNAAHAANGYAGHQHKHAAAAATIFEGVFDA